MELESFLDDRNHNFQNIFKRFFNLENWSLDRIIIEYTDNYGCIVYYNVIRD